MKRKKIAILMACVLSLTTLLTGCGSKKEDQQTAPDLFTQGAKTEEATPEEGGNTYEFEVVLDSDSSVTTESAAGVQNAPGEVMYDSYIEEPYPDYNTEEYNDVDERGFAKVSVSPLSTFSADVDTASYSNLRRMIEDGYRLEDIPEGSVRIEEILNYFDYDYNLPKGDEPFGVTTEMSDCPWNEGHQLLTIGLKTEEIDFSESVDSNLVFLLDVSGSMSDYNKLPLLQQSFCELAENLTEKDRVSIVTYAGEEAVLLEGANGGETELICDTINNLYAGGSTNGSAGIETAYALAEEYFIEGGNNRVILATDGDLNVGVTSESALTELVEEKRESGIYLTVLGFGTGNIKDNKMEALADNGNGNYAYIDCFSEAKKVLVEEMGATFVTVAKDVKLQVEFNPEKVAEYRLIGYENRALNTEDFEDDTKDAGEIGAGHTVTAVYEIVPADNADTDDSLKYSDIVTNGSDEWLTVSVRYKEPEGDESILLSYPVDESAYTKTPSDDWKFAAAATEFGLVVSDSDYKGDGSLKHVKAMLKELDLEDDEYKDEFYDLVKKLERNS